MAHIVTAGDVAIDRWVGTRDTTLSTRHTRRHRRCAWRRATRAQLDAGAAYLRRTHAARPTSARVPGHQPRSALSYGGLSWLVPGSSSCSQFR